jgi:hypothetical protein
MKTKSQNVRSREISFRNRQATLARLVSEMLTLRKLVRLEEMKVAGETATARKEVNQSEVPILAGLKCGRTSAPRLPQALHTNRGSISESLKSSGH